MTVEGIREKLFELQDEKYRDFQQGLIPSVEQKEFIGIRTPALRKLAKELYKSGELDEFFRDLPHKYFDENQLHAFAISEIKDFDECMKALEEFLPFVDNWATSDQMSPKVFKKNKEELFSHIKKWLQSDHTYTVRFGIGMLMQHFLDEDFDLSYPEMVAGIRSDEYYINMMIAWYFATALAKQYESILPFIEEKRLSPWTHNKAIQKSVESYRITDEQKTYLRRLKVKI
ncbi:DNA alkylation repair protein [Butyrivibrio sp. VCB2001]|uniref:DNA alkylation repair protein n=1 Tax=Butyrivibrio sp. VCB2001 TaxID=1280667 RepID=UPI00040C0F98|nr:DNA alkylation repair protein [Butyrivibrio sp. VCB2001]